MRKKVKKLHGYFKNFFRVSKNKNSNPGIAKKVDRIKNLYHPKICAKIPELEVKRLRASEAKETKSAYCVALKAVLHKPLK